MKGRLKWELNNLLKGVVVLLLVLLALSPAMPLHALTTADVTVNATPAYVSITCNVSDYDFGLVAMSSTTNTTTTYFGITNASTVNTNNTISVTGENWTGGIQWIHDDAATPAPDTVGMNSQKGGTWGAALVVVQYTAPQLLSTNQTALTDWQFGLSLLAPTSFSDALEKSNVVRITATSV